MMDSRAIVLVVEEGATLLASVCRSSSTLNVAFSLGCNSTHDRDRAPEESSLDCEYGVKLNEVSARSE